MLVTSVSLQKRKRKKHASIFWENYLFKWGFQYGPELWELSVGFKGYGGHVSLGQIVSLMRLSFSLTL